MGLILIVAGPLVLETFFKHYLFRNPLKHEGQAREDLMYDEGESPACTWSPSTYIDFYRQPLS